MKGDLSQIDVTTPGKDLLTKKAISNLCVSVWWIGISVAVILILLVVYTCLKKKYWFW